MDFYFEHGLMNSKKKKVSLWTCSWNGFIYGLEYHWAKLVQWTYYIENGPMYSYKPNGVGK